MRLYLVRHGETEWNREHRVQGQSDQPLNEAGRRQAEALARAFADRPLAAAYSSPLRRAYDTAQAIARARGLSVQALDELKELHVGVLDGLTFVEMRERYGDFMLRWREDATLRLPGGGETLPDVQARAWPAIERIRQAHGGAQVVVVSHYFLTQVVLCTALGLPLTHFRRLRLGEGSVSVLDFSPDGRARVVALNDSCHLTADAGAAHAS
ncbi:MAG: histidine phosphatase family protein [Chloroflexi bacterium]|nr:histidine phosphatase family protein [Chloroflexota bacterium]